MSSTGGGPGDGPYDLVPASGAGLDLPGPSGSWDLDLAAASLRFDTADVDALFEALAAKLERILGPRVQVRRSGLRKRRRAVQQIVVDTAGARLEARRSPTGPVFCSVHAVRGITLQTQEIDVDAWLAQLVTLVRTEAGRSNDVRNALGGMLET